MAYTGKINTCVYTWLACAVHTSIFNNKSYKCLAIYWTHTYKYVVSSDCGGLHMLFNWTE